ncbi:helix-turn-helix domain-containing protein [Simplicispira metamorpha]|jgi:transcriptional regulator with XRE-family HTH domain|uniref:Xre family transcriptional regulator n=1 Tax=Simplicispira metamorpha TaxID=80881 RepID=A0A4R2N3I5_9BURK|nr:helix-turn-helix domain-containing protein [Simplicispira metamorpha]TCP14634.1 Xre family transcriptional regulator [Simplicispira metamorpha]
MNITSESLATLASQLMTERKRQKLSREQAAAVCNVSTSFIRDAESNPARCSLGKLLLLMRGLGLSLQAEGWSDEPQATQAAAAEGSGPA